MRITILLSLAILIANTLSAQSNHAKVNNVIGFELIDSVYAAWAENSFKTTRTSHVYFAGRYMCSWTCDFSNYWKCYPEYKLFERRGDEFVQIEPLDFLKGPCNDILSEFRDRIQHDFMDGQGRVHDCFEGMELDNDIGWSDISLTFNKEGVVLLFWFDAGSVCDAVNETRLELSWAEAKEIMKYNDEITPSYCTPSGPKVNVRSSATVKADAIFQLDKGEFFEIIEIVNPDNVNGKSGNWLKIRYGNNTGYIFSYYTLCR